MVDRPTTFDDLYPGRFLKAGMFKGAKVTMTISDVVREELEGEDGKKHKVLISFRERPLQLVTCKTNGLCIRAMFGDDVRAWVGKRVTLFPSKWNNEPCIRVWGSPDINEDFEVEVKLPRRKPIPMMMHAVGTRRDPGEEG